MFNNVFKNKVVLVTGHSGFKGSWLCIWLKQLGAKVVGYSLDFPSTPNNFEVCTLKDKVLHVQGDIRDIPRLQKVFLEYQPEIVFHLAAQPLVRLAYQNPAETFDINVMGTLNVLDCIRATEKVKAAVMITSDKCYLNKEWAWGYRENDELGGADPYSASKGCAELVIRSYCASYFANSNTHIASARAGNVIGGGDWAADRIVPDCVRAWSKNDTVQIRHPESTRPWQHVLEPLSGYLALAADLYKQPTCHAQSFNFGPDANVNQSVQDLIGKFQTHWSKATWQHVDSKGETQKESTLLKLSCDKVLHYLGWQAALNFSQTVELTAQWYKNFYQDNQSDMYNFSLSQIQFYVEQAKKKNVLWVNKY